MNTVDCIQGDAAWFKCRLGCVTSSRVADAICKLKRKEGEAAVRRNMRFEIACEVLTGKPTEHYVSRWMKEGKDKEPLARNEYELATDTTVEQVGFVYHSTIRMAGASPDGVIGEDGLLEIKCPMIDTHLQYLIDNVVPDEYLPQMLWQMACCERDWVDFVSYHPDVPQPYQLFVKRVSRTQEAEAVIRGMESEVCQFLSEVDGMMNRLRDSIEFPGVHNASLLVAGA